jgi:hypothetical protein
MLRMMHIKSETTSVDGPDLDELALRPLSAEEVTQVSGGMMDSGGPRSPTHTPGRLTPDESEYGTIAGAGL